MIHTPRGLLLFNPMNVMENAIEWQGQKKPTADPEGRLAEFDTMGNGIRAGAMNLRNQQRLHGLNTWRTIIRRYAPPTENDTDAYIAAMCHGTMVTEDTPINLSDPAFLTLSAHTIIIHEQGYNPCTGAQMAQGIAEALA